MGVNKNNVKIHVEHLKKNFGKLEVLKDVSTFALPEPVGRDYRR